VGISTWDFYWDNFTHKKGLKMAELMIKVGRLYYKYKEIPEQIS